MTELNDENALLQLNKDIGELKAYIKQFEKKQAEFDAITMKQSALLEILKPNFIVKIKEQDVSINSLKLNMESVNKLQDKILAELKNLKEKIEFFDYERVLEIDKEVSTKLRDVEKFNAKIEKNSIKFENIFKDFNERYIEFRQLKIVVEKLNLSFEKNLEEFAALKKGLGNYVKKDDFLALKDEIKSLNKKIKESATKEELKKLKSGLGGLDKIF